MHPVLVGYFPKKTFSDNDYMAKLRLHGVESISHCLSSGPEGWIEHWTHNNMHCYDSEEIAWSVVPLDQRQDFRLFAYRLFPLLFVGGEQHDFHLPPLVVSPLPASYIFRGYDVVGLSSFESPNESFYQFTCSPLSCNLVAEEVPVNDCCLLTSLSACFSLAEEWSAANGVKAEPGDYVIAEVWTPGSTVTP